MVSVVLFMAIGAYPFASGNIALEGRIFDATIRTDLCGSKAFGRFHEIFTLLLKFVLEIQAKVAEPIILLVFRQLQGLSKRTKVEVFHDNHVIAIREGVGFLVEPVFPLVRNFRMEFRYHQPLAFPSFRALHHAG